MDTVLKVCPAMIHKLKPQIGVLKRVMALRRCQYTSKTKTTAHKDVMFQEAPQQIWPRPMQASLAHLRIVHEDTHHAWRCASEPNCPALDLKNVIAPGGLLDLKHPDQAMQYRAGVDIDTF